MLVVRVNPYCRSLRNLTPFFASGGLTNRDPTWRHAQHVPCPTFTAAHSAAPQAKHCEHEPLEAPPAHQPSWPPHVPSTAGQPALQRPGAPQGSAPQYCPGAKMTSEVQYVPSGCPLVLSALRSQHLLQAETSVPRDENLLTAPPGCQSHQIDLLQWKRLFFSFLLPFLPSWQLSKICMQIKAVCSKGTNFINNALCYHWCPHSLCSFLNTDWFCAAHCISVWASLLLY